jgi:hypothetical protein
VNAYVTGGYSAVAGMVGVYAVYVRRRARSLSRALREGSAQLVEPVSGTHRVAPLPVPPASPAVTSTRAGSPPAGEAAAVMEPPRA